MEVKGPRSYPLGPPAGEGPDAAQESTSSAKNLQAPATEPRPEVPQAAAGGFASREAATRSAGERALGQPSRTARFAAAQVDAAVTAGSENELAAGVRAAFRDHFRATAGRLAQAVAGSAPAGKASPWRDGGLAEAATPGSHRHVSLAATLGLDRVLAGPKRGETTPAAVASIQKRLEEVLRAQGKERVELATDALRKDVTAAVERARSDAGEAARLASWFEHSVLPSSGHGIFARLYQHAPAEMAAIEQLWRQRLAFSARWLLPSR
ncbi:MAG: hypothetical protein HYV63_12455 [Candidatus Schekmanbacteria bacterium]|nr:hypothetical protein [Candidatus Schekmanbacteria bacterium]